MTILRMSYLARASKVLTVTVFIGITGLLILEYRATRAAQQSVEARVSRQNEETADLIIKAITRDMRGAQSAILANRDWDVPLPTDTPLDITEQVATTFARYPYPESFFTWRGGTQAMLFFSRATRPPAWMPPEPKVFNSPIAMAEDPPVVDQIRPRIASAIQGQLRYAVFQVELAGVPYQVIARITYTDALREHVESVSGFTVNLDWVRRWYFSDILSEVEPTVSGGLTQDVSLIDDRHQTIFGRVNSDPPVAERRFPLLFMDSSDTASDLPPGLVHSEWELRVGASRDPVLVSARRRGDTTLFATGLAVILCGISLMLAYRAALSEVKLTEMRSRFVSSVTHELKTPLANIRALAATLARESQVTSEKYKAYPHLVIQEANNLSRLVDNLLAYARITDVTEAYAFEPMAAAEIVDEALKGFQPQLMEGRVAMDVETSQDMPFVRADQRALVLALRNLVDNAIRHIRDNGKVSISTSSANSSVLIRVQDNGCGISKTKLAALRDSIASRAFSPSDGGGLGLAIASKIVADHKGTLTVESELGVGTRCTIVLPAES